jgi:hypothetical protein
MNRYYRTAIAIATAALLVPSLSMATVLGTGRLTNVVPLDGGCVAGPSGGTVQFWNVEPGKTYQLTLSSVTDCANGGTDALLNVRVNNTDGGNTEAVATFVAVGVYTFNYTLPATATCTLPIFYCTTPGDGSSGMFTRRDDGGAYQAHLQAATFDAGCTNPQEIVGADCGAVPSKHSTWGRLKMIYR